MIGKASNIGSPEEYRRVFNQAERLRNDGKIPEAAMSYANLLRYRLDWEELEPGLPFTINEFFIVDRLGDIALLAGNKTAARHLFSAMAHLSRSLGNITMRIHVVTKLMFVNLNDGQIDAAIENIQSLSDVIGAVNDIQISPSGLPEWEHRVQLDPLCTPQDEADQFVCLYDALGALLLAFGRFSEGILMLQRGIQIGEKHGSPLVDSRLVSMKLLSVKAFFQKGEIQLSTARLSELEQEAAGTGIASGISIHLLDIKSKIALVRGDMGEACRLVFETAQLCRQHHLTLPEIKANFNLAQTKVLLNQVNDAEDILKDCLIRAQKLGETALSLRISQFLKVADNRIYVTLPVLNHVRTDRSPKPLKAPKTLPETELAPYQRSEDYLGFFEEKSLLFQLHLAENRYEKAAELHGQLRLLVSKCDSPLIHIRFQVLEFMLLYFTNTPIPANFPYQDMLDFLTKNQFLPELWQFRQLLYHTELVSAQEKSGWINENQVLLDRITATLPPTMQALYLLNKWSPNEEFLAGFSDELLRLKQKIHYAKFFPGRWWTTWKLMKKSHVFQEETTRYKDHLTRSIGSGTRPGDFMFPGTAAGMFGKLWRQPKGTLSVSFLVLPDRVVIISKSFLKIRFHLTNISRVVLRQLVFALRDWLYPEGKFRDTGANQIEENQVVDDPFALVRHLEKILQIETILKEHGQNIRHIRFLADDVLHGFPFTIFSLSQTGTLKDARICVSTDDRVQNHKQIALPGKEVFMSGTSKAVAGLHSLPGVLKEIKEVSGSLSASGAAVQVFLDESNTLGVVKKQLPSAEIAHFSCHGKFDFQHPDQSGLLLSDGQLLTLRDILSFSDLSRLKLLVLSSCRGAEHFVLPGRWIIGLPETFCRAGVEAILAFLWPVEDDFASAFTTRFYEHLKNHPPAESFRLTVLNARNKEFPELNFEYWHPRFWAGAIFYER